MGEEALQPRTELSSALDVATPLYSAASTRISGVAPVAETVIDSGPPTMLVAYQISSPTSKTLPDCTKIGWKTFPWVSLIPVMDVTLLPVVPSEAPTT